MSEKQKNKNKLSYSCVVDRMNEKEFVCEGETEGEFGCVLVVRDSESNK